MGSNSSKTMQSTASFVSNATFNAVVKTKNIQQTSTNIVQNQSIDVTTDPTILLTCITVLGPSGYDCSKLMASGTFSNVSQVATYNITATDTLSATDTTSVQNQLTAAIQNQMSNVSDDVGSALKSIATAAGGDASSTTSLNQTVQNTVNTTFTQETVNQMINSYASAQAQAFKVSNSTAVVHSFSQSLQVQALTQMLSSNSSVTNAVNKADATLTGTTTVQSKGLTDLVASIGSTISGVWAGATSTMKVAIIGGVAVVCVIPVVVLALGKSGAIKTAGDIGKSYVDKMPVAIPV